MLYHVSMVGVLVLFTITTVISSNPNWALNNCGLVSKEAKFHKYYKINDSNPIIFFFNPPYNLVQGDAEKNLFPLPQI